jgi:hypothetical protein
MFRADLQTAGVAYVVDGPGFGQPARRDHHVKPVRKFLKSRGFRRGVVKQIVLVRIFTGELGVSSKVAEAGVYGKKPRVSLVFFAIFPRN